MLGKGIEGKIVKKVQMEDTAEAMKSGTLKVFATPAMIALIEETAWKSVASEVGDGNVTVGTSLNIKHLSASPLGIEVTCRTRLEEVDGRRLVFSAIVEDEMGKVGEGFHERFIVRADNFQQKADEKISSRA